MQYTSNSDASDQSRPRLDSAALDLRPSANIRRLSAGDKAHYQRFGYLKNLPVFDDDSVQKLQSLFYDMAALLPEGVDINKVNMWHKAHTAAQQLIHTSTILDYVEDLIGENFFLWGNQFFVKYPNDGSVVPFHQDAQYWPLTPMRTVTAWLAIFDADEANSAMQIVRGSHNQGIFQHHVNDDPGYVLEHEVSDDQIEADDIVTLDLKAGQISLHDDRLLHGSKANVSDRIRCGMTFRFSPTEVKCDLSVWPTFETYLVRGVDEYQHNPVGKVPKGQVAPVVKFQHSSEFV